MERKREPAALSGPLGAALRALAAAFSELSVPAMLIGGMAVIARGVPRLTRDVDATVAGGDLDSVRRTSKTLNGCSRSMRGKSISVACGGF